MNAFARARHARPHTRDAVMPNTLHFPPSLHPRGSFPARFVCGRLCAPGISSGKSR
jgi:hypothetical protein